MACVICKGDRHGEKTQEVFTKGLENLVRISLLRDDGLVEVFQNVDSIVLHSVCYKHYICTKYVSGEWVPCGMNRLRKPSRNPVKFVFNAEANSANDTDHSNGSRNIIDMKADKNDMKVAENFETIDQNFLGSIDSTELNVTNSEVHQEIAYVSVSYDNDSSELEYCPQKNKDDKLHRLEYKPNEDNLLECDRPHTPYEEDLTKPFPFEHLCFICAKDIGENFLAGEYSKPQYKRDKVYRVHKGSRKQSVLKNLSRTTSHEVQVIKQRIQDVDLVQMKAGYHRNCMTQVLSGLNPKGSKRAGRPLQAEISVAMDKIFKYIEEENCANCTSTELLDLLDEEEKLHVDTLKNRLIKRYGEKMYFTNSCDRTVFSFVKDSGANTSAEKRGDKTLNRLQRNANGKQTIKKTLSKDPKNINYGDSFEDPPCSPGSDLPTERSASDTNTLCHICWSDNRQLEGLGEYADVCWRICGDDFKVDSGQLLVCWECRASLRHALRFQQRARASTWFLNGEMEWKCLSSMTVVTPALSLISCKPDKTQTRKEDDYTEENTDGMDVETCLEELVDEDIPQASNDDEIETYDVAFSDDGESDHQSTPKRPRRSIKENKTTDKTSIERASSSSENNDHDWDDEPVPAKKKPAVKNTSTTSRSSLRPRGDKTKDDGDSDDDSLIEVVRTEPPEINKCRGNERDSTNFTGLEKKVHSPHICTKCNVKFNSYYNLKDHNALKHHISRTENAYCVQCDIQFDNEMQMKRHLNNSRKHANERKGGIPKPYQKEEHKCPSCPKVYTSSHSLKIHYRYEHAKEIRYYCQHCKKSFPWQKSYKSHMKLQHQGHKLPQNKICEFCGRGFTTNRMLSNHVRTHTGERPFACEHCPAAFAQRIALRTHVKHIHLGLKRGARTASTGAPANGEQS